MREQDKTFEKELNKMELTDLPEKEFNITVRNSGE